MATSPSARSGTSTIYDNSSAGDGGGLFAYGYTYLSNTTVAGNAGFYGGGLASINGLGIDNTISANNTAATNPDLQGAEVYADFSLIESPGATTVTGSQNITGTDPQLGALANNGGPTQTMKPAATSPVVDKGLSDIGVDQRFLSRPVDNPNAPNAPGGDGSDIGSVELTLAEGPQAPVVVPPAQTTTPPSTFNLKKAIKKCKKKFRKGPKRKKCIKKAKRRAGVATVRRGGVGREFSSATGRGRPPWLGGASRRLR